MPDRHRACKPLAGRSRQLRRPRGHLLGTPGRCVRRLHAQHLCGATPSSAPARDTPTGTVGAVGAPCLQCAQLPIPRPRGGNGGVARPRPLYRQPHPQHRAAGSGGRGRRAPAMDADCAPAGCRGTARVAVGADTVSVHQTTIAIAAR
eukprot:ctg_1032.g234